MNDRSDPLVAFYSGQRPDHRSRFLREIQQWDDGALEREHDFIQWLFPLPEPSPVNPAAPVLTTETIRAFHGSSELQSALRVSLVRMLSFYGFEFQGQPEPAVQKSSTFSARSRAWLQPGNHNHLRITRILRAVRLLGLEKESRAFFKALKSVYDQSPRPLISERSFAFWSDAAGEN